MCVLNLKTDARLCLRVIMLSDVAFDFDRIVEGKCHFNRIPTEGLCVVIAITADVPRQCCKTSSRSITEVKQH